MSWTDDLLLYDYQQAPSARRVRIFLAEKGVQIPTRQVDLAQMAQFAEDYRAINPWAVVPALRLADGTVIGESMAICRYIEACSPTPSLFGESALEQAQIEMWQRRVEQDGLAHCRDVFRNQVPGLAGRALQGFEEGIEQIPALVTRGTHCLKDFFATLDRQLQDNPFVAGDRYSVADITALVTADFAQRLKTGYADKHQALKKWHSAVKGRPSAAA